MSVIRIRHETRRESKDSGAVGFDRLVRFDIGPRVSRIAAKPDEVIYVAVTLLKEAIEIMKRAPDQVREDPADRGIWVRV